MYIYTYVSIYLFFLNLFTYIYEHRGFSSTSMVHSFVFCWLRFGHYVLNDRKSHASNVDRSNNHDRRGLEVSHNGFFWNCFLWLGVDLVTIFVVTKVGCFFSTYRSSIFFRLSGVCMIPSTPVLGSRIKTLNQHPGRMSWRTSGRALLHVPCPLCIFKSGFMGGKILG